MTLSANKHDFNTSKCLDDRWNIFKWFEMLTACKEISWDIDHLNLNGLRALFSKIRKLSTIISREGWWISEVKVRRSWYRYRPYYYRCCYDAIAVTITFVDTVTVFTVLYKTVKLWDKKWNLKMVQSELSQHAHDVNEILLNGKKDQNKTQLISSILFICRSFNLVKSPSVNKAIR